jgi:prepilin-type processing-associated H-X9-DG protein
LAPYYEQKSLYDQIMQRNESPWAGGALTDTWTKARIQVINCPSDAGDISPTGAYSFGTSSYGFCSGDNIESPSHTPTEAGTREEAAALADVPIRNRGMFGRQDYNSLGTITDGTSNTIALAERSRPRHPFDKGMTVNDSSAPPESYVPLACRAWWSGTRYVENANPSHDTAPGYRWADGSAFFAAVSTILPPNTALCQIRYGSWRNHYAPGIWTATSEHPGGVNVAMADGSVRFISETIDTGNLGAIPPSPMSGVPSPYGVWGALGTKAGQESVSGF